MTGGVGGQPGEGTRERGKLAGCGWRGPGGWVDASGENRRAPRATKDAGRGTLPLGCRYDMPDPRPCLALACELLG